MKVIIGTPGLEYRVTATLDSTVFVARLRDDVISREAIVSAMTDSVTAMESAITVMRDQVQALKADTQTLHDDTASLKADTQTILDATQGISDQAVAAQTAADSALAQATNTLNQATSAATTATNQAGIATTKATEAADSATQAGNAATGASASETVATDAATSATQFATSAETFRDEAATHASSALSSATTATGKAADAESAATNSALSAAVAGVKATEAETSATGAAASASGAATSAINATISETNAATSATSAATSESNATAKALEAETSAASMARPNLIVDPSFEDWQEGTSFSLGTTTDEYTATLHRVITGSDQSGTVEVSRVSGHNSRYAIRIQGTHSSASGMTVIASCVEGMDQLADEITVSVDGKADTLPGTVRIRLVTYDSSGTSQTFGAWTNTTLTEGGQWNRASVTLNSTGHNRPPDGHWVIQTGILGNGAFDVSFDNLKVEKGTSASSFTLPDPATEQARIGRYFEKSFNHHVVPGTANQNAGSIWRLSGATMVYVTYHFETAKRVPPSITTYAQTSGTVGKVETSLGDIVPSSISVNDHSFYVYFSGAGVSYSFFHMVADARF